MAFKWHFSDTLALLVLLFFGGIAWLLLQNPTLHNQVLAGVLGLGALRVLYEITFNRRHVPTVGSGYTAGRAIVKIIQADCAGKDNYTVVDLGSGRGGLVRQIARALPHATVIGIERAALPHWQALLMQRCFGPKNARFLQGDIFAYDCRNVNAVVIFLSDAMTQQVAAKLRHELPPQALFIASMFPVPNWAPETEVVPPLNYRMPIRAYRQS